jgi:choline dehydrogenase
MSELSRSDLNGHLGLDQKLSAETLRRGYDYIICGAGPAGCVVASRLVAETDATVLVLEAGGTDDLHIANDPNLWRTTLGGELDWGFTAESNPNLNGRAIGYSMGKALGGGSTINVSTWSRGHKTDWDFYAAESGNEAWSYASVLGIYRNRVESWTGAPDSNYRGSNGMVHVQPSASPHAFAASWLEAAQSVGLRQFPNPNGLMMEANDGCSLLDETVKNGKRQSIFRSYLYPLLNRKNLTVLTGAIVSRVVFTGHRATGVEFMHAGKQLTIKAEREVIMALGAVHTPKVLMQSGIGDKDELKAFDIPVRQSLPGVGRNLHDHMAFGCLWEKTDISPLVGSRSQTVAFWKSAPDLDSPDFYSYASQHPFITPENAALSDVAKSCWSLVVGMRPQSRGEIRLTGASFKDPVKIDTGFLREPSDLDTLISGYRKAMDLGRAEALRPFTGRSVAPYSEKRSDLETFFRNGVGTFWHPCGTAKMGRDVMSVIDGELRVYGVEGLRIADASVLPRVTTGNTAAPCVIVGEQAANFILNTL